MLLSRQVLKDLFEEAGVDGGEEDVNVSGVSGDTESPDEKM
ncbi:hypothetical protein ACP4OV_008376 [Aristida adscensionis]